VLETPKLSKNVLYTLGGLAAILIGGNWVVNSSMAIATSFGVSQTIIGLTIVAVGTSLPELITSITAARKKNTDIAIGNIVGSNIFNIFFVLGVSAFINPIGIDQKLMLELFMNIALTLVLLAFSRSHSKIVKWEGVVFILLYVLYMAYLLL
jgi:cation:H+ antiporter